MKYFPLYLVIFIQILVFLLAPRLYAEQMPRRQSTAMMVPMADGTKADTPGKPLLKHTEADCTVPQNKPINYWIP